MADSSSPQLETYKEKKSRRKSDSSAIQYSEFVYILVDTLFKLKEEKTD